MPFTRIRCSPVPRTGCATDWCGRRDSNPHIFRYWNLNPARLPIPPRPRGRLKVRGLYQPPPVGQPAAGQPSPLPKRSARKGVQLVQQLPPIPEEPENPPSTPQPSQPGQPSPAPPEEPGTNPNIDVPSPSTPGTQPPTTPISPVS